MKYKLGDIAPIKQGKLKDSDKYWLLNLDMIESGSGRIIDYLMVNKDEIGSSTITFDTENVLYSKLRPYLNKVVLPQQSGYATSEMLPLKPNLSVVTREYLTYFLRSPKFVCYINEKTSGAKMPRASISDLKAVEIDCPDIDTQKKVTEAFDKLTKVIAMRQKELSVLDSLVKARFVEMFGDLMLNPYEWPVVKISDVSTYLKSGLSRKLSDDDIGLPVIRSGNIQNGQFVYENVKYWYKNDPQGSKTEDYILEDGDVLVNFINSESQIGKSAIFRDIGRDCIYTTNIFRMKLAVNCNEYYYNYFAMSAYYYRQLRKIIQPAVNQASFTTVNFLKLSIPLPPIDLQEQFADFVRAVDKLKVAVQKALDEAQLLFDSLMQEHFG